MIFCGYSEERYLAAVFLHHIEDRMEIHYNWVYKNNDPAWHDRGWNRTMEQIQNVRIRVENNAISRETADICHDIASTFKIWDGDHYMINLICKVEYFLDLHMMKESQKLVKIDG